LTTLINSLRN